LKTFVEMPLTELVSIVVRGGGASAPRTVDFLAVGGLLPVQSLLEEVAVGFAGRTCCTTEKMPEFRRTSL
jgi:hypothetical protein